MNDLVFKVGSTGRFVEAVQRAVGAGVDGKFGPGTLAAVRAKLGAPKQATFTRADLKHVGVDIRLGIDLSGHNEGGPKGLVDFARLKRADVTFCILKLSEGERYENREALRQAAECQEHEILFDGYHFGDPSGARPFELADLAADAIKEAEHFLAIRRAYFGGRSTLRPTLDLERMYQKKLSAILWAARGGTPARRAELCALWCLTWLEHVEKAAGRRPYLYTGRWAWNAYLKRAPVSLLAKLMTYPLWLASYNGGTGPKRTIPGYPEAIWQQSGSGSLPGVDGKVDINFALLPDLTPC